MYFKSFYLIIAFIQIQLILNETITIFAKNEVITKCENGLYSLEIKVSFSSSSNEYYSFPLELISPTELKLKCSLDFKNDSIFCFGNLDSNKFDLEIGEFIIFPPNFPILEDIEYDYDSFVKNIYGKEIIIENDCLSKSYDFKDDFGLFGNIEEVNEGKCIYSTSIVENKYNFKMKTNIKTENLAKKIENSLNDNYEIEFLQDIWVPILINVRKKNFRKFDDIPFAICSINKKLSINNLMNEEIIFDCNIPIIEGKILIGQFMIKPFYDYLHMKIISNDDKINNKIIFENIGFNINRTIEKEIEATNNTDPIASNSSKSQLRRIEETDKENNIINNNTINFEENEINEENKNNTDIITEKIDINTEKIENENIDTDIDTLYNTDKIEIQNTEKIESEYIDTDITTIHNNNNEIEKNNSTNKEKIIKNIDYFIVGAKQRIFCPDRPIFIMTNSNKDILLFSSNEKDYIFMLKGRLVNGLQVVENAYYSTKELLEDIFFTIQVVDNLAEDEDNPRVQANCSIKMGTPFFLQITIFCHAQKISEESMYTNNTDITLNWGLEKNKIHNDIIIKWPNEKKKIKHMYSYNIQAFSLAQSNYGCVNNEFYFYIYIFDLEYEADFIFELDLKNPNLPKAICKLYESSILKCYFPLYQQKLEKSTQIDLPTNFTYNSINEQGNKVTFEVEEYFYDYEDFHIQVRETCGENFIVGALKKAGLNYFKVFLIIISILFFAFILFILFICFVIYKIRHRNKKGLYVRHVEEDINSNFDAANSEKKIKSSDIISQKN